MGAGPAPLVTAPLPSGKPSLDIVPSQAPARPRQEKQSASGTATPEATDGVDTESRIAELLLADPRAKSKTIAKAIGKSEQRVRTTTAWRENRERLQEKSRQRQVKQRLLTHAMLASIDSKSTDPADIVTEQEEQDFLESIEPMDLLRRRYLENADADQRARFHRLNAAERDHELRSWELTGDRME